jgi:hypothetical protein
MMTMPLGASDRRSEKGNAFSRLRYQNFRDVQSHIFVVADLVECTEYAAFENRPEALNHIGVNGTDDVVWLGSLLSFTQIASAK